MKGEHILVVEDDQLLQSAIADSLEFFGFRVTTAATAFQALGVITSTKSVHCVVTDIGLPGGHSGLDLYRTIKRHWPDIPVILTSGYSTARLDLGWIPAPFLSKPYAASELIRSIKMSLPLPSRSDPVAQPT